MNLIGVAIIVFLLLGIYTIYLDASQYDESFLQGVIRWGKQLSINIKSITGYAVKEHTWLPEAHYDNTTQ